MRLAQIELALNPAPRIILQLAAAPQFVYAPPFSGNEMKLDLVALLRAFSMVIIALAIEFRELEPICIVTAKRLNGLLGEIAFQCKRIEALNRRLDPLPARLVLFNCIGMALSTPRVSETEGADPQAASIPGQPVSPG
jgi:hypothetical protein